MSFAYDFHFWFTKLSFAYIFHFWLKKFVNSQGTISAANKQKPSSLPCECYMLSIDKSTQQKKCKMHSDDYILPSLSLGALFSSNSRLKIESKQVIL